MNEMSLLLSAVLLTQIVSDGNRKYHKFERYLCRFYWKPCQQRYKNGLFSQRRNWRVKNRRTSSLYMVRPSPARMTVNLIPRLKSLSKMSRIGDENETTIFEIEKEKGNTEAGDEEEEEPPTCGVIADDGNDDEIDVRIVGGSSAKLGDWPWIVALGYKVNGNQHLVNFRCGGVLITQKHILTAAHCVQDKSDLFSVRLGEQDFSTEADGAQPRDIRIIATKVHENYDPVTYANDIAIVTIEIKLVVSDHIRPACLPLSPEIRQQNFTSHPPMIAGWGAVKYMGETSPNLLELRVPIIDNEICRQKYEAMGPLINNRTLCAGYLSGGRDACQGDSGGPLIWSYHKVYYVIGIVSFGYHCAEPEYPGVYTRVTEFTDWILENLNLRFEPDEWEKL